MSTTLLIVVGIILMLAAGAAYAVVKKQGEGRDIAIAAPATLRTDLLYGYYGTHGDQVAETADHVNLLWLWAFLDAAGMIAALRQKPCFGVMDCQALLFSKTKGSKPTPRADAEAALRAHFVELRDAGVLHLIKMLVPLDEPNLSANEAGDHLPWAVELMRRVAAGFPDLQGVLFGCIYVGGKDMPHTDLFDVVGFDRYGQKSGIFAKGADYDKLRAKLNAGQRTIVIPGGSYSQDPTPFIHFAHSNPEVMIVLPFLWASVPWEDGFKGIRDLGVRDAYVQAGTNLVKGMQ